MSGNHHITLCTDCGHSVSIDLSLGSEEEVLQAIRDGHIPSESSCRAHDAAADAVQSKIDELDRPIERLQTLTEEVEEHRDRLIEYSEQQRALAAPVQLVPAELWETIFRYACAETTL